MEPLVTAPTVPLRKTDRIKQIRLELHVYALTISLARAFSDQILNTLRVFSVELLEYESHGRAALHPEYRLDDIFSILVGTETPSRPQLIDDSLIQWSDGAFTCSSGGLSSQTGRLFFFSPRSFGLIWACFVGLLRTPWTLETRQIDEA